MHTFKVWAPRAHTVAVLIAETSHAMTATNGGWWTAKVEDAGPGTDYFFIANGNDPIPDPRSPYQPNGVNGPSRVVDHSAFRWTDGTWNPGPLSTAIVYELHVGTFTAGGTFKSTIECLDHLVDVGITH